ncbi:MAG: hypothetical protein AB9919_06905 [Geobacteraceae bacterium]
MTDQITYRSLEKYKYQLLGDYSSQTVIRPPQAIETEYISLTRQGLLTIRKGYAWNGANKPAINNKTIRRGSLVHDALYQLIGCGLLAIEHRITADQLLRIVCLEDGMIRIRAWWVYQAVRLGGASCAKEPDEPEIEYAP